MDTSVLAEQQGLIYQFRMDTGCSLEDLPGAIDDRHRWRESIRKIWTVYVTWWWWVPNIDSFVNDWFNGISTLYGLFNAKIWFIYKWLEVIITIFFMFHWIFFSKVHFLVFCFHTVKWFQVFFYNTKNLHAVIWFQVLLSNTNNFHAVIWFQVFLSNTNNLHAVLWFQVFLSNTNNFHAVI